MTDRRSSTAESPEPPEPGDGSSQPPEILAELRVRRLVVVDEHDRPCVVAEVTHGQATVRLLVPDAAPGERVSIELFARPGDRTDPEDEPGRGVGLQLCADGNLVASIDAWGMGGHGRRRSLPRREDDPMRRPSDTRMIWGITVTSGSAVRGEASFRQRERA